jgi:hypothetical protein
VSRIVGFDFPGNLTESQLSVLFLRAISANTVLLQKPFKARLRHHGGSSSSNWCDVHRDSRNKDVGDQQVERPDAVKTVAKSLIFGVTHLSGRPRQAKSHGVTARQCNRCESWLIRQIFPADKIIRKV